MGEIDATPTNVLFDLSTNPIIIILIYSLLGKFLIKLTETENILKNKKKTKFQIMPEKHCFKNGYFDFIKKTFFI